ncbi:MAG: glycosyltransferase family 4 protein [Candidatus Eisenbacteria bacterium]|nr:glycosyltransferase family 4 protein [Candidatus Eisenbacteria bacterium]
MHVALLHPLGMRGIGRYTHNLANAVAPRVDRCSLLTSSRFELRDLPRAYRWEPLFHLWDVGARDNRSLTPGERLLRPAERITRFLRYDRSYRRATAWVRRERPSVIHTQEILFWWEARHLLRMGTDGTRLVITCHNVEDLGSRAGEEGGDSSWMRRSMDRLYTRAAAVIVHGAANREDFIRLYPEAAEKVWVVPHGCEPPPDPNPEARARGRRRWGVGDDEILAVNFGEVKPYKGLETLIDAAGLLAAGNAPVRIVVAGLPIDPAYGAALEARRAALDAGAGRLTLDFRYIPGDEASDLLRAADLCVLTHRRAYQSGVLALAFTHGLPAVVSDAGALGETVRETGAGVAVPAGDTASFAREILRLASDGSERKRMAAAATRAASGPLSWEESGRRTMEVYKKIL